MNLFTFGCFYAGRFWNRNQSQMFALWFDLVATLSTIILAFVIDATIFLRLPFALCYTAALYPSIYLFLSLPLSISLYLSGCCWCDLLNVLILAITNMTSHRFHSCKIYGIFERIALFVAEFENISWQKQNMAFVSFCPFSTLPILLIILIVFCHRSGNGIYYFH